MAEVEHNRLVDTNTTHDEAKQFGRFDDQRHSTFRAMLNSHATKHVRTITTNQRCAEHSGFQVEFHGDNVVGHVPLTEAD
jgi:hypothetical protein